MKIDWGKAGAAILGFLKKYGIYIIVILISLYIGYKFGWNKGLFTALASGGLAGGANKVIKSNQESRKKKGEKADDLLEKAKGGKTTLPLIFLLVIMLVLGASVSAAPGTVPMDEYLKVVSKVEELKAEIFDLNERLAAAIQAAELYKSNWEEAEADLNIAMENSEALEKDKLILIGQISKLQNAKFGVQAIVMYNGDLQLALAGSYSNFLLGATYNINTQLAGLMAGFKVEF